MQLVGRPLEEYFLGEKMHQPGSVASLSESNKFLAEDRILCFELVAKRSQAWVLRYVRAAHASTDVPDSVAECASPLTCFLQRTLLTMCSSYSHLAAQALDERRLLRLALLDDALPSHLVVGALVPPQDLDVVHFFVQSRLSGSRSLFGSARSLAY